VLGLVVEDWGHFSIFLGLVGPPDSTPKNVVGCGGNETGIGGVLVSPNYPVSHSTYYFKIYQIWKISKLKKLKKNWKKNWKKLKKNWKN
jgi:hypothetical protein